MNNGYTQQIRDRITNAPDGSVFVNSDFADIADSNTIKQSINPDSGRDFAPRYPGDI